MTRLCLIGNSHLGAFKRGCDEAAMAAMGIQPVFYGSIRDSLQFVEVRDGRIVPTLDRVRDSFVRTSGGSDSIDVATFDAFVLVGLSASIKRVSRFYRANRWYGQVQAPGAQLVRRHVAVQALSASYAGTRLAVMARMIRSLTDRPILAFAEPFWSDRVLDAQKEGKGWRQAIASGDAEGLRALFGEALQMALLPDAALIPQPHGTVSHGVLTAGRFSEPGDEGDEDDFAHMGGDYGRACWVELLRAMGFAGEAVEDETRAA